MNFTGWFSRRINLRHGTSSTSTGAFIAVAGVALAVMIMELSIAVTAGFKQQIEQKILGFDAAVTVLPPYDFSLGRYAGEMTFTDSVAAVIADVFPEARAVESLRRHAVLKTDSDFIAVECFAYGASHDSSFENGNLIRGHIPARGDSVAISLTMARQLRLDTADRVFLYFFTDGKPRVRRAHISGIYNSNFGEYDRSVAYVSLPFLQGVGNDTAAVSSVSIEGIDYGTVRNIPPLAENLQKKFVEAYRTGEINGIYPVTDITEKGAMFFSWLDLLDTNVVVIFILMAFVAGFTLISSLFIIILDRIDTIGILRSLGASKSAVSRIFVNVALKIVGLGMIIGNAVALGIIWLQHTFRFLPLNPDMYYLDSVPFSLSWQAFAVLNISVAAGAWLILILPARLASGIDPATTVRYE